MQKGTYRAHTSSDYKDQVRYTMIVLQETMYTTASTYTLLQVVVDGLEILAAFTWIF